MVPSKIDKGVLKVLEYPKVLDILSAMAATNLGKAAALNLLPATEYSEVEQMLNETKEAFNILNVGNSPPFGGASDIYDIVKRAQRESVLLPEEIATVGNNLYAARRLKDFFVVNEEKNPLLLDKVRLLVSMRNLEEVIERSISLEQGVKDEATSELAKIRREVRSYQNKVKEKLENILRSSQYQKYFQEQLVTMRADRYVIPIKQEYRQFFPGIVHDQSGSGATVFIEPLSVVDLNNDVKKMLSAEKEEIERILRLLSKEIGRAAGDILNNLDIVTHLDLVFAKAKMAQATKATSPTLDRNNNIKILGGRHPLIAADIVVPIDVQVGGGVNTLVITGSNAGGKTVTLKIIGLFSLMAQAGLFLPAKSDTVMPVFKDIYADIGDEQSIEQSLSTFSGQIKNLVEIIKKSNKGSLILLDEVCAGTDPKEGASLAIAILEKFQSMGATTVLTTHYSELKTFAFQTEGMENASVEFDSVSLEPTYRLLMGMPGSSNAFHIATGLGLEKSIVEKARSLLDDEHQKMEDVLQSLEKERKQFQEKNAYLASLESETKILRERVAKKEQEIVEKKREIIDKYRNEASEVVRQARLEAESAIKEIKAMYQETDSKNRQKTIDSARKKLTMINIAGEKEQVEGEALTKETAELGKVVYIPSLQQKGTITSISGKEVGLQIGVLKMNLSMAKCVLTNEKPKEFVPKTGRRRANREVARNKAMEMSSEIDVRGKTIEEAILDIDKYIDDAILANISQVRIIHGKGTGALRKGLTEYFDKHQNIRSHTMAALNEGGSGATVVFL